MEDTTCGVESAKPVTRKKRSRGTRPVSASPHREQKMPKVVCDYIEAYLIHHLSIADRCFAQSEVMITLSPENVREQFVSQRNYWLRCTQCIRWLLSRVDDRMPFSQPEAWADNV
jgi:hypothetical protein